MDTRLRFGGAVLLLSLLGCKDEEKSPCQALWDDFCARAVECNPSGPDVVVLRTTESGYLGLTYSSEADCAAGAGFCNEAGPLAECQEALSSATCESSSPGEPKGIALPAACNGID